MSRTIRKIPLITYWSPWQQGFWRSFVGSYHRRPRTQNARKQEASAAQALRDEGFYVPPRLASRANPSGSIPHAWDDLNRSAYQEMDYNNGQLFKVEEAEWP